MSNKLYAMEWWMWILILGLLANILGYKPTPTPTPQENWNKLGITRIAVLPFTYSGRERDKDISNEEAASIIEEYFIKTNRTVISRIDLKRIIKEQKLQQEDMFDEATAVRLGKLVGVDGVVVGHYSYLDFKYRARVKIIRVEDGRVVFSAGDYSYAGTAYALDDIIYELEENFGRLPL